MYVTLISRTQKQRSIMSNFRKFTEFCAGISAFTALMYVFRQYMSYDFEEAEGFKEKIKIFFDTSALNDYRAYLLLAALIILAISVSLIFKRLPELSFFFSAFPFFYTIYLFDANKLYEKPMLFICLSIIQIAGNIYDSLRISRERRRYSPIFTSFAATLLPILFCLVVIWRNNVISVEPLPEKIYNFDHLLMTYAQDYDMSLFKTIAIMYGIILLISVILRGVHFIDFGLSLVPLCFVLYKQAVKAIGPHDEIIMVAAILCTVTHLCLMIGNSGLSHSVQSESTQI